MKKGEKKAVTSTCKTVPVSGIVSSMPLLLISWTPKQLNLIKTPLCDLTDQLNIPEV